MNDQQRSSDVTRSPDEDVGHGGETEPSAVPDEETARAMEAVRRRECPKCGGRTGFEWMQLQEPLERYFGEWHEHGGYSAEDTAPRDPPTVACRDCGASILRWHAEGRDGPTEREAEAEAGSEDRRRIHPAILQPAVQEHLAAACDAIERAHRGSPVAPETPARIDRRRAARDRRVSLSVPLTTLLAVVLVIGATAGSVFWILHADRILDSQIATESAWNGFVADVATEIVEVEADVAAGNYEDAAAKLKAAEDLVRLCAEHSGDIETVFAQTRVDRTLMPMLREVFNVEDYGGETELEQVRAILLQLEESRRTPAD